ncbi:MAG: S-adenosylmethionine:tRNA ribosyltransferase-isomerase [Bdellovibrionales bacterium]
MFSLQDLLYDYPEELVAKEPHFPPRVLWAASGRAPEEVSFDQLIERIPAGDVIVLNDTQVLKRRVFAQELEILFLSSNPEKTEWEVLFPSKDLKVGAELPLLEGLQMVLLQKGRPQKVRVSQALTDDYFERWAELPLPPYIQKARGERHNVESDQKWYQTAWAKKPGSLAAPTASLHFKAEHLEKLKARGVQLEKLTLHVGLGTFLPLSPENLARKELHEEWIEIPTATWQRLRTARKEGRKIWALGTTVTRSLEACALGHLQERGDRLLGTTKLFIQPGFEYQMVDRLMTNFHQPGSSLMALVMAFFGIQGTRENYRWIVERRFRLFSYGDFSIWLR